MLVFRIRKRFLIMRTALGVPKRCLAQQAMRYCFTPLRLEGSAINGMHEIS